jgi:hypothetical protein
VHITKTTNKMKKRKQKEKVAGERSKSCGQLAHLLYKNPGG